MIVPRTRLLLWVALIVLPFAAAGATIPGALPVAVLLIAGLLALAVGDALAARRQAGGVRVHLPESTRLLKDRPGYLAVRIENTSLTARSIRLGFEFPREISTDSDDRIVELPEGAPFARLEWPVTPTRRGRYFLERAYLETVSPLGFWGARTSLAARSELKVYPNLMRERKHVAALFLKRGQIGVRAQRQVGQGREFEKLRDYIPGDSYDEIHWKASAKRGRPVTKVFQVERTQEVYVIIDRSRLSARAAGVDPTDETTLERSIAAGLIVGAAAEKRGDLFGLAAFSDQVDAFVRARNGKAHYAACRDAIYQLHPKAVTPDFDEIATFLRLRLRRRAMVLFLTSLDDPVLAENFARATKLLARRHLVLAGMLRPPAAHRLFEQDVETADDVYRGLAGHIAWRRLKELEASLARQGVRLSVMEPEGFSSALIGIYDSVKQRQLL